MSFLENLVFGMGNSFASSLLGLAGSLVVGLLELFASHAQNRFYRQLEEWLSSITKIGIPGIDGEEALTAGNVLAVIGQTSEQIDGLREVVEQNVARSSATELQISELVRVLSAPRPDPITPAMLERIALAQEKVAAVLESRDDDTGQLDVETRARLRSIDTQVVRILEDMAAGRQDLVTEIRQDIAALADALRAVASQRRP
jgi:hypothetical protein